MREDGEDLEAEIGYLLHDVPIVLPTDLIAFGCMELADVLEYGFLSLLLIGVGALLLGQVLGQPILLAYVETGSMAPTMQPGDGFIAVPAAVTPPPEHGDIIVFEAQELHGGGLTTHRVVNRTEAGYITRGDANPFTDQAGVEPPVSESQIVAEALRINGEVVVIPDLGTGIRTIQESLSGVAGLITATLSIGVLFESAGTAQSLVWIGIGVIGVGVIADAVTSNRRTSRSERRSNYIKTSTFLLGLVLIVITPATASMVLSSGTTSFDIVSSQAPNEDPFVIGVGDEATIKYRMLNDGFIPVLTVIEPNHPDLSVKRSVFIVPGQSAEVTLLTVQAPESTGAYSRSISEWRYIPILPRSVILFLHGIHPYIAMAVIDIVLVILALSVGLVTIGLQPLRLRSEDRNITLVQRLKRRFL